MKNKFFAVLISLLIVSSIMYGCSSKQADIISEEKQKSSLESGNKQSSKDLIVEQENSTTATSSSEHAQNTAWSLKQSEALKKAMVDFGNEMNQIGYVKVDTPQTLNLLTGESFEGYTILESYQYQNGETLHRYFFVVTPTGEPQVLYSTGDTNVKNTANELLPKLFSSIFYNTPEEGIDTQSSTNTSHYENEYFIVEFPESWGSDWTVSESVSGNTKMYSFYYDGGGGTVTVIPNRDSYMVIQGDDTSAGFFSRGATLKSKVDGGL